MDLAGPVAVAVAHVEEVAVKAGADPAGGAEPPAGDAARDQDVELREHGVAAVLVGVARRLGRGGTAPGGAPALVRAGQHPVELVVAPTCGSRPGRSARVV